MIRLSAGTAGVLGLNSIRMEDPPTCAYIMLGTKCEGTCGFCAQSSLSKNSNFLSRITWNEADPDDVYNRLAEAYQQGRMKRACFQVVQKSDSLEKTLMNIKHLKGRCPVPVCVSINGIDIEELAMLFEAGAQYAAVSFDAAHPRLFPQIKGKDWDEYWDFFQKAVEAFPGRIVVHLIIGLGETEKEAVEAIIGFQKCNAPVSLFAFTPLPGTPMASRNPPALDSYRRIQMAHYIIRSKEQTENRCCFACNNDEIFFYENEMDFLLKTPSEAFQTFGCPDCNRPLYNEKPGEIPYNYPRKLTEDERLNAIKTALNRRLI